MPDWLISLLQRRQLLVIAGLAALGLLTLSYGRMILVRADLGQRAAAVAQETDELQTEHARLQQELARLQSDESLERLARERLGLAKPGESAALIVGSEAPRAPSTSPAARPRPAAPNWMRWWRLFFG